MGQEDDVLRLFGEAERLGPLRAVVNNAGVTGGLGRVEAVQAQMLRQVFAVNVVGVPLLLPRSRTPSLDDIRWHGRHD